MGTRSSNGAPFEPPRWTAKEEYRLRPFVSNVDRPIYAILIPFPELVGALCSRASRAGDDLRGVLLREFLSPFLDAKREEGEALDAWRERERYARALQLFISRLNEYGLPELFANPKARAFYQTWLAQYGDDSIAQMSGAHLAFAGLSQIALKHLEDQRIGLAPIEKSTRYVDYAKKINGSYAYFTDGKLARWGMLNRYRSALDRLFETYAALLPTMVQWLAKRYPDEKPATIRAKAFDLLRGLLPAATISQAAFFGNGQAFEYMMGRSRKQRLSELRWIATESKKELDQVIPAFLRRVETEQGEAYQRYLAGRRARMTPFAQKLFPGRVIGVGEAPAVRLVEYDPDGEDKIIAGMLYNAEDVHDAWETILERVRRLPLKEKRRIIRAYLSGRTARWQKVGRAFENAYVRFEIVMNIGAYRDLHRHRMLTQERQLFSCHHGFDVPDEVKEAGLGDFFREAVSGAEDVFLALDRRDPEVAQYAVTLAHRVRFMQWENLREFFWEAELRSIPEGHPDYRAVEQEKYRLLKAVYPTLMEFALVNMNEYDFARRGQEEKIAAKEKELRDMK